MHGPVPKQVYYETYERCEPIDLEIGKNLREVDLRESVNLHFHKSSSTSLQFASTLCTSLSLQFPFIAPHLSPLHFTSLHCTSAHLTSLHFNSLHFTAMHFTSPHFTSRQCPSLHFTSLHFTSLHFTSLNFILLLLTAIHREEPTLSFEHI